MTTWIILLRGINVVGRNMLAMKDLSALLDECGCCQVKTYIQSGNAVFRSSHTDAAGLARRIEKLVSAGHGFQPRVFLIKRPQLEKAAAANPFPQAETHGATLHLSFLAERPRSPDLKALNRLKAPNEEFVLKGNVFYLHAPDGIGRSKLAANIEKRLGVETTSRNWNTVTKMIELAKGLDCAT